MKKPTSKYVFATRPETGKSQVQYVCQTAASHTNCPRRARAKITMPTFKFMGVPDEKLAD